MCPISFAKGKYIIIFQIPPLYLEESVQTVTPSCLGRKEGRAVAQLVGLVDADLRHGQQQGEAGEVTSLGRPVQGRVACRVSLVDRHLVSEALPHQLSVAPLGGVVEGAGGAGVGHCLQQVAGHKTLLALHPRPPPVWLRGTVQHIDEVTCTHQLISIMTTVSAACTILKRNIELNSCR